MTGELTDLEFEVLGALAAYKPTAPNQPRAKHIVVWLEGRWGNQTYRLNAVCKALYKFLDLGWVQHHGFLHSSKSLYWYELTPQGERELRAITNRMESKATSLLFMVGLVKFSLP